jgi:hypothetical protein
LDDKRSNPDESDDMYGSGLDDLNISDSEAEFPIYTKKKE